MPTPARIAPTIFCCASRAIHDGLERRTPGLQLPLKDPARPVRLPAVDNLLPAAAADSCGSICYSSDFSHGRHCSRGFCRTNTYKPPAAVLTSLSDDSRSSTARQRPTIRSNL